MSTDDTKKFKKLVPGEPAPQFGGLTPEAFANIGDQIEAILLGTFGSYDGAMTMYVNLTARMMLDVEEAAGPEARERVQQAFDETLRAEIRGQRILRARLKERDRAEHAHNKGLN